VCVAVRIAGAVAGLLLAALIAAGPVLGRTIAVSEYAALQLVRKSGSTLYERGTGAGTLPGTVTARFVVTPVRVTGAVTIRTRHGLITMRVDGYPLSYGVTARASGTMTITGGTRRYEGASGVANFTGTVNRRSWAATVHATGRMTY
jgi:hypothetical protein